MKIIQINSNDVLLVKINKNFEPENFNYIKSIREVFEKNLDCKIVVYGEDLELTLIQNKENVGKSNKCLFR